MGPYFADFFVPHVQLDIELDGKGHEQGLQYENDEVRTAWMEQQGIAVLRIPAADVMRDVSSVVECIQGEIDRLLEEQP